MPAIFQVLTKAMRYHLKLIRLNATRHHSNRNKSVIGYQLHRGYYTNRLIIHQNYPTISMISRRTVGNVANGNSDPNPNPTKDQRIEFMVRINKLYIEYKQTGIIGISDDEKLSECDKCKLVTERYLDPFTLTILPNHANIKCCVPILEEEQLLLSISQLTGVSELNLKQYFKDIASNKIDEKDVSVHQNSFQYNGNVHYCRVSAIAHDICLFIGPCHTNHYFNSSLDISISNENSDNYTRL